MPHYDYECSKCSHVFEEFHKMSETPEIKCPKCGSDSKKKIGGGAGIIFKGAGFYKTDYAKPTPCGESSGGCASCASGAPHQH